MSRGSSMASKIALGDKVKDSITAFEGVVVCITFWLFNCVRVGVQPTGLHDGKPIGIETFDEDSLVVVEKAIPVVDAPLKVAGGNTGGPRDDARAQQR